MYVGIAAFAAIAVLCVIVGLAAMKRRREYGHSEDGDDFDFQAYEGFDKD